MEFPLRTMLLLYLGPLLAQAVTDNGEGCGSALSPVNYGTCGCDTLTLANVTRNHSGRYVCQVSINKPMLIQFRGNGTMITIRERRSPTNGATQQNASLWPPVPVVVSLAIVMAATLFFTLICLWKLQRRRGLDRASRVKRFTHGDSEVDGTSTSLSKGSSQWCQVPVYESFDYFERVVESKGSG
ncbi:unnamed protein product [Gadus morhua 'NCC']